MNENSLYAVPNKVDNGENVYEVPTKTNYADTGATRVKTDASNKWMIALTVIVAVLVLVVAAASIGFALEITKLKSERKNFLPPHNHSVLEFLNLSQQQSNVENISLTQSYQQSIVENIFLTQSYQQSILENITHTFATIYSELNERIVLLENTAVSASHTIISCAALPPSSPSGYYWVSTFTGPAVRVYCDMTRSCGGVTGGWMRVAHLDMTNSSHQCPRGLIERSYGNVRTCVRAQDTGGCSSIWLHPSSVSYNSVCGKIKGYQHSSTDAFLNTSDNINTAYVDGVSLTYGNPRNHIWTFASAHDESHSRGESHSCPCVRNSSVSSHYPIPSFVGTYYFCDTGSEVRVRHDTFYSSDPLWDGAGCGPMNTCCSFNTPPWFYKQLPQPTTDDIEMRVCRDEPVTNENIAIERVDVFVQ